MLRSDGASWDVLGFVKAVALSPGKVCSVGLRYGKAVEIWCDMIRRGRVGSVWLR